MIVIETLSTATTKIGSDTFSFSNIKIFEKQVFLMLEEIYVLQHILLLWFSKLPTTTVLTGRNRK